MVESALRDSAEGQLARLHAAVPGLKEVTREFVVRVGNPALEILQAALVLNSELVVIATHGHTGLKRLTLGSTAERVLRHASCPVLVLHK
jgi:nucleotide-binding universal stress UspA family protein